MHSIGYLHLDLNPENIVFLGYENQSAESSRIEIIDFGLA